jgi:hypothetical protein
MDTTSRKGRHLLMDTPGLSTLPSAPSRQYELSMASKYEQALDLFEREKSKNKNLKAKAIEATTKVVRKGLIYTGSAAAGVLDGKYPGKKLGGMNYPLVFGAVLNAVDLANLGGKASESVGAVGDGLVGAEIYKMTRDKVAEMESSSTSGTHDVGYRRRERAMNAQDVVDQLEQVRRVSEREGAAAY